MSNFGSCCFAKICFCLVKVFFQKKPKKRKKREGKTETAQRDNESKLHGTFLAHPNR